MGKLRPQFELGIGFGLLTCGKPPACRLAAGPRRFSHTRSSGTPLYAKINAQPGLFAFYLRFARCDLRQRLRVIRRFRRTAENWTLGPVLPAAYISLTPASFSHVYPFRAISSSNFIWLCVVFKLFLCHFASFFFWANFFDFDGDFQEQRQSFWLFLFLFWFRLLPAVVLCNGTNETHPGLKSKCHPLVANDFIVWFIPLIVCLNYINYLFEFNIVTLANTNLLATGTAVRILFTASRAAGKALPANPMESKLATKFSERQSKSKRALRATKRERVLPTELSLHAKEM